MSAESASGMKAWIKIVLATLGAVLVGFLAFLGYQYSLAKDLAEKLPTAGETISFTDRGVADKFLMSQFSFAKAPLERVGDVVILESVIDPSDSESRIVLGQKDGLEGVMLGKVRGGDVEVLLSDGTNKSDLAAVRDGVVVFTVSESPLLFPEEIQGASVIEPPESTEREETGKADGPVPLIIETQSDKTVVETRLAGGLFAFDLTEKKLSSLGAGKSPRAYGRDAVLAISDEGVVVINAFTGARATLIPYRGGNALGSSLSENGMIAALRRDASATVELFRISDAGGVYLGQIFSASPMYGTAILGEGHIFVRTGRDTVALYALSEDLSTVQPHIAELGLLMPN